jgi:hypothetical protein
MRFWPRSAMETIREAFAFLTNDAGYRLVSESGSGACGAAVYSIWLQLNFGR